MAWGTSGMYPTEFDRTTNLVLRTIQAAGTTDWEIAEDQSFLCDLMQSVGKSDADQSMHETMEAMDVAFIGLLVHRHLPYRDGDTGEITRPAEKGPANYTFTMNIVANMLIEVGIPPSVVEMTANEGAARAVQHMRPPESFRDEALTLHTHVVALFVIGILVHRLMPTTTDHPLGE